MVQDLGDVVVILLAKPFASPHTAIEPQRGHALPSCGPEPILSFFRPKWPSHILHEIQLDEQTCLREVIFLLFPCLVLPADGREMMNARLQNADILLERVGGSSFSLFQLLSPRQSSWLRWHPKPVCSSLINEKPHKFDVLQRQLAIRVGALSCRHIGPMLIHGIKIGGMHSSNLTPRPLSRSRRRAGRSTLSYSWQKVHTSVRHLSRTKLGRYLFKCKYHVARDSSCCISELLAHNLPRDVFKL